MSESAQPVDWKCKHNENVRVSTIIVDDGLFCSNFLPKQCTTTRYTFPHVSSLFHHPISEHSAYDH